MTELVGKEVTRGCPAEPHQDGLTGFDDFPRELAGQWGPLPLNPSVHEVNEIARARQRFEYSRKDPWWLTRASIPLASSIVRGVGESGAHAARPGGAPRCRQRAGDAA
ncbi:hypothetical protein ACRYGS_25605 [Mycobacteroides abscessus]